MTAPMAPLPAPVPLDAPPGNPCALADLVTRLDSAGALLGDLGGQLPGEMALAPGWTGRDADAAGAQLQRVGTLVRAAAEELRRASTRVALHQELLADAHRRLAGLRDAQEAEFGAAALRLHAVLDPAEAALGAAAVRAELQSAEADRRRLAAAIHEQVADDAAATAAVLAECAAVVGGGGGPGDVARVTRFLEHALPGWRADELEERGLALAAALLDGDDAFDREAAARDLLPWAGNPVVAAAVLTGLGEEGLHDLLRQLGDGSLSSGSALARALTAVLAAPVPVSHTGQVADVLAARQVDTDPRSLDGDLVALGMGVVLAAGRGNRSAGPPAATVREWGRQIVARERALGSERIVDRVRATEVHGRAADPLAEVLVALAAADDPAPAAGLLRGQPTWSHLLERPWDDGGEAFAALVERAGQDPDGGDVAVRSGLRALAAGLGDDGAPARWTVDRDTAAAITPALGRALAGHADVAVEPLARAADGEADTSDRAVLRGLGLVTTDEAAATAVGRALDDTVPVAAGYLAVREYGARLDHALTEFGAQEQAQRSLRHTDAISGLVSLEPRAGDSLAAAVSVLAAARGLDGTWEESVDVGPRFPVEDAVHGAEGERAEAAYRSVADLLGTPTAPRSPAGTDWWGLLADAAPLLPGTGRLRQVVELGSGPGMELIEDLPRPFG